MENLSKNAAKTEKKNTLKVLVFAPGFEDPEKFTWRKNLLVEDAAKKAAKKFKLQSENPGLEKNEVVLDQTATLNDAGVEDKDELELIETSGGVYGSFKTN